MDSHHVDVSIILVNFRTPKLTSECVSSIFDNVKSCSVEIVVVDNASDDNSVHLLREQFNDKIKVIPSSENLGFGRANNLGASQSVGEFVFFLNSDTILKNDPFEYFLPVYKHNESVGVVGAYLVDGSNCYTLSGGNTYSAKKYLKVAMNGLLRLRSAVEVPMSTETQQVDYVIGADMFIRKSLFEQVGGFNPKIFMYFEDVELCDKIVRLSKRNYLIPGPEIVHFVKSSSTSQFSRVYNTASLMYCLRQKMKPFSFRLFQLAYFALKSPLLLNFKNFKNECQYVGAIYKYKNYLVK